MKDMGTKLGLHVVESWGWFEAFKVQEPSAVNISVCLLLNVFSNIGPSNVFEASSPLKQRLRVQQPGGN